MHLEDVSVEGFKSFSEPTRMSFQPGIGVVIGNNGVGKSNILDAIVWGMGELDVARLRCLEPEDLFFAGSKAYPPAKRIRVELTFKEHETELRLARQRDRDGVERFWMGDTPHSAHSFRKELTRLGLPHTLKTIIRQERINDALRLDTWHRFQWACELLGVTGPDEACDRLAVEVAPLFRRYLECLFPDGQGHLQVVNGASGNHGLHIEVTLPGNRRRKAHQLSGGEQSVTSLALKLALFDQLESPTYLLDEVEPSLDYVNHKAMQTLLRELAQQRQLIMITHLRSTIELAHTVHGVRARWDGSSFMKFHFLMDERLLRLYARTG